MAKKKSPKEKRQASEAGEAHLAAPPLPGKSVLAASYEAFQRGDMVTARRLAREVLSGKRGPDDEKVAAELSPLLSAEGAPVAAVPADVAKELVSRTVGPGRPYVFAAVTVAVFVLLVVLAVTRYQA